MIFSIIELTPAHIRPVQRRVQRRTILGMTKITNQLTKVLIKIHTIVNRKTQIAMRSIEEILDIEKIIDPKNTSVDMPNLRRF